MIRTCFTRLFAIRDPESRILTAGRRKQSVRPLANICAALLAIAPFWSLWGQEPQIPIGSPPFQAAVFGMVGVARGQTARLNVSDTSGSYPCSAELGFVDADGNLIKSSRILIEQGKSRSLDLIRDELQVSGNRVQARAVLSVTGAPVAGRMAGACAPIATVEVFDNETGRTTVTLTQSQPAAVTTPCFWGYSR